MALRGFGQQTITGSAQPVFGTTLSAASNQPSPDMFTGNLNPASARSSLLLTVANPFLFQKGDRISVGAQSSFLPAATLAPDIGQVTTINTGANTILVTGLTRAHANGEFVVINTEACRVRILVNADTVYIGGDSSVAANSTTLAEIVPPGTPYDLGPSAPANVYGTGHYWLLGTAADTYLPNITTI